MVDKDAFAERGRSLEEEYFRRKEKEVIEKMRRKAEVASSGSARCPKKSARFSRESAVSSRRAAKSKLWVVPSWP